MKLAALAGVLPFLVLLAAPLGDTTARLAQALTPSNPVGGIYRLTWEQPSDRLPPETPPPGWRRDYDPNFKHSDGLPQLREQKDSPVRGGAWSGRFHLERNDPIVSSSVRAELKTSSEPAEAERWYGFSVYLARWDVDPAGDIITQWHQASDNGSPPLAIGTRAGKWRIWQALSASQTQTTEWTAGTYQVQRWTDWVVHVKWSRRNRMGQDRSNAVLEVWKDGMPVTGLTRNDTLGKQNTYNLSRGNYMKFGIYKWPWRNRPQSSTTNRRVLFYDELRIGDEKASLGAVAPRGMRKP